MHVYQAPQSTYLCNNLTYQFDKYFRWSRFEHPRFGLICAIQAICDLESGTEVLVNYGMGMSGMKMNETCCTLS